jgi:hypothetical protein
MSLTFTLPGVRLDSGQPLHEDVTPQGTTLVVFFDGTESEF